MQRYGDLGQNTKKWLFSSVVCCDRKPDLRQRAGRAFYFVGRNEKRLARSEPFGVWWNTSHSCHVSHLLFEQMGDELVEAAAPGEELMAGAG